MHRNVFSFGLQYHCLFCMHTMHNRILQTKKKKKKNSSKCEFFIFKLNYIPQGIDLILYFSTAQMSIERFFTLTSWTSDIQSNVNYIIATGHICSPIDFMFFGDRRCSRTTISVKKKERKRKSISIGVSNEIYVFNLLCILAYAVQRIPYKPYRPYRPYVPRHTNTQNHSEINEKQRNEENENHLRQLS